MFYRRYKVTNSFAFVSMEKSCIYSFICPKQLFKFEKFENERDDIIHYLMQNIYNLYS